MKVTKQKKKRKKKKEEFCASFTSTFSVIRVLLELPGKQIRVIDKYGLKQFNHPHSKHTSCPQTKLAPSLTHTHTHTHTSTLKVSSPVIKPKSYQSEKVKTKNILISKMVIKGYTDWFPNILQFLEEKGKRKPIFSPNMSDPLVCCPPNK